MDLLNEIIRYSEDVTCGKIVACKKHKWACERFLHDLDRDFDYIFDVEKAQKFIDWMKLFKHRKGILAGKHIDPVPIQKFIFGNIYGWVHKETELRRFNKGYWQIARKNAKSQSMGCLGNYELSGFGEYSSEVYCAATKKEQARIVWDEAVSMINNSKISNKFKIAYGKIQHPNSDSFFRALSKDDRASGDGLNPQCGIIDEFHAHQTAEYYEILETGMGARKQPLMFIITTAGMDLAYPCYRVEYQYVSNILNPNIDIWNDRYFAMVNELDVDQEGNLIDDINDETVWQKPNPILASYDVGMEYLRERVKIAQDSPEKLRGILTKNFNVWVNWGESKYMDIDKWKACQTDSIDYHGRKIIFGVDLSATIDLCSVSGVFIDRNDKIDIISHSFIPRNMMAKKMKVDKMPYDLWERQGFITITDGDYVDYNFIKQWIIDFADKYNLQVQEICFDKWNATQFAQDMENEGFEMVEVIQGIKTLSEPTKKLRAMVYNGDVRHENNPLLNIAMANAVTRSDHNENLMLDKSKSYQRIDPAAALMTAMARSIHELENCVYDTREKGSKLFDY